MQPFTKLTAIAAPLLRINIDTDAIIPSKEMKSVGKHGLSAGMFAHWRYNDPGNRVENPEFVLNEEPYRRAGILLTGRNFGCGSSREHAVWAMREWGFRVIVAPSFGAIFRGNCVRNGILPVVLKDNVIKSLSAEVQANPHINRITLDLPKQILISAGGISYNFDIAPADKEMLVEGLDPIGITLKRDEDILAFTRADRVRRPWVYL